MTIRLTTGFLVLLLLGCINPASGIPKPKPESELIPEGLPVLAQFWAAINARDSEGLKVLIDENFRWRGGDTGGARQSLVDLTLLGFDSDPSSRLTVLSIRGATEESPLFWVDNGIHLVRPQFAYKISYQHIHRNLQHSQPSVMKVFVKNGKIVWLIFSNDSP